MPEETLQRWLDELVKDLSAERARSQALARRLQEVSDQHDRLVLAHAVVKALVAQTLSLLESKIRR